MRGHKFILFSHHQFSTRLRYVHAVPFLGVKVNSLLTFSSGKILLCRQTQIRFGVPVQCLCSKDDNVSAALQMALEKFVCSRMRLWRL